MRTESWPQAVTVLVSPVLADCMTNDVDPDVVAATQITSDRAERKRAAMFLSGFPRVCETVP